MRLLSISGLASDLFGAYYMSSNAIEMLAHACQGHLSMPSEAGTSSVAAGNPSESQPSHSPFCPLSRVHLLPATVILPNLKSLRKGMSATGPSLPAEIIRMIFEILGKDSDGSLHELSLTSRFFNIEATRILYRSIAIEDGKRHYKFLSIIRQKPKLAALVRKYHAPLSPGPKKRPFWPLLCQCLSLMTGLKELAYLCRCMEMKLGIPRVKKDQPFPFQLEKFIWRASLSRRGDGHLNELLEFFETQPSLQELVCTDSDLAYSIPEGCFPNLKVVEGDISTIKALVPTRRTITQVYWKDCSFYDFRPEGYINQQMSLFRNIIFPKVRGMSVMAHHWTLSIFQGRYQQVFVDTTFQRLQVLEIVLDLNLRSMQPVLLIPPMLPKLKRVSFRFFYPNQQLDMDEPLHLFDKCPDLLYLDLWVSENLYQRWIGRDAVPKVVNISEENRFRLPDSQ